MLVERYRSGAFGLADIHLPGAPRGTSVLLVHGGGFVIGSRRMPAMRVLAPRLADAGIAVCCIDYRLLFRGGGLAAATDDVCAALAFWRARAPQLGLAGDIALVGLSAGGTLALAAAARERVARVAACFGLYEIAARPLAAHPSARTLLLHGAADRLVRVGQAHRLAAERAARGLPTRLVVYPGARHGFLHGDSPAAHAGTRELIGFAG